MHAPLSRPPFRFVVNGRFFAAKPTGVQRVAREHVRALDALIAQEPETARPDMEILLPPGAECDVPVTAARVRTVGPRGGQAWEQAILPLAARGGLLVNFANTGPMFGPPSLIMIHDAQVYDSPASYGAAFRAWYRVMQPRAARRARAVLTVSHYSATRLAVHNITGGRSALVIHNAVDHLARTPDAPETLSALGLEPGGYVFGLASDQAHKNMGVIIEAFRDPRLEHVTLALAGAGARLREAAAGMANVTFVGFVDDPALKALYTGARAFVFPSRTEGFGLPPLEAMWCGAPVIAAPCGATPEASGAAALYAGPDDVDAWVAAIHRLATDDGEAERRRAASRAQAAPFTWARSARKLLDLIARLAPRTVS